MAKKPDTEVKSKTDPDPPAAAVRTFWVQGPKQGRWRAGMRFGEEPVEVTVTLEQFEAIEADPLLKIVDAPKPDAASA